MKQAIVLTHAPYEGPARLAPLLEARGYRIDPRPLHDGTPVPERIAPGDLLVVMGGAMGVADAGSAAYPFLRPELALLERCLADRTPVLGICLGSQLLAAAAGARVYPAPALEVGWAPVRFGDDPVTNAVPIEAPMLHWHGDTFDLPAGATRFASTAICPNQAFHIDARAFGLQFHPEVSVADLEAFIASDEAFARRALGDDAAARIRRDTREHFDFFELTSRVLLGNVVDAMTR